MPMLAVPVLHRPEEDEEFFVLVRFMRGLQLYDRRSEYAAAFDLPGLLQYHWRRQAETAEGDGSSISEEGFDEDASVDPVALLRMSTEDRREYLQSLPEEVRNELFQALQARLRELEE